MYFRACVIHMVKNKVLLIGGPIFFTFITYGGNVNYYKSVIILFLLWQWEQGTPWQFSKQISKFSFKLSFQIYSLLTQTERERKAFFGRVQEGGPDCEIIIKSTWLS